ncbi:MAG: hypothetical protein AVDCRST_MAG35-3073 [uncultured Quadrisphaera sp.]|uniref:Uncharacterized protein n=1 Tax=uncultured Quadrisphaera sp. TaxID=904978 RepID=A0A6J4QDW5_9ACTN|nr:MAG: hypothetical protein AVDCRST_MAG35-3073 [uncultured Quadrisphaera sp.]
MDGWGLWKAEPAEAHQDDGSVDDTPTTRRSRRGQEGVRQHAGRRRSERVPRKRRRRRAGAS